MTFEIGKPPPGRPHVWLIHPFFSKFKAIWTMWFIRIYVWSLTSRLAHGFVEELLGGGLTLSLCFYPWSTSPTAPLSHFVFLGCCCMLSPLHSLSGSVFTRPFCSTLLPFQTNCFLSLIHSAKKCLLFLLYSQLIDCVRALNQRRETICQIRMIKQARVTVPTPASIHALAWNKTG